MLRADLASAGHPPFRRFGVQICGAGRIASVVWRFCRASLVLAALIPTLGLARASAQGRIIRLTEEQLAGVLPLADRFDSKAGDPPVFKGYSLDPASGVESLMGYAFITSDFQPEVEGYSAPIRVLVGMDLTGALTGIEILYYRESLQSSRGGLSEPNKFPVAVPGKVCWRSVQGKAGYRRRFRRHHHKPCDVPRDPELRSARGRSVFQGEIRQAAELHGDDQPGGA